MRWHDEVLGKGFMEVQVPPPKGSEDIRESIGEGRAWRYKYTKIGRSCEVRLAEVTAAALWG